MRPTEPLVALLAGFVSFLAPVRAAARAGLSLGRLRCRGGQAQRARVGTTGGARQHPVRARLHGRLRRPRHRRAAHRRQPLPRPVPARADRRVRPRRLRARLHGPAALARAARRRRPRAGSPEPRLARCCSAARSRSARRRASARCSLRSSCSPARRTPCSRERSCSRVTRSGLAIPFVLAGAIFTRAMGAFRWLRDHYVAIQFVSGAIMVALGLLLFFGRFYSSGSTSTARSSG